MDIYKVIKAHGYNSVTIAKELTSREGGKGVSQAAAYKMLNGNPTLDKLQAIADILNMSLSELIAEAEGNEPNEASITCPKCGAKINIKAK